MSKQRLMSLVKESIGLIMATDEDNFCVRAFIPRSCLAYLPLSGNIWSWATFDTSYLGYFAQRSFYGKAAIHLLEDCKPYGYKHAFTN